MIIRWLFALCILGLSACTENQEKNFQGYVEGEYVYLASGKSGRLQDLPQTKGSWLEQDSIACRLESDFEEQALRAAQANLLAAQSTLEDMERGRRPEEVSMAKAQLRQAKADAVNAKEQLRRDQTLRKSGGVSQRALDDSIAKAKATAARVAELESQVDVFNLPERDHRLRAQRALVKAEQARVEQAQWELAQKTVKVPQAGLLVDTLFREGEWVATGNPVIQLLPPGNVKIRFFVPERQLADIKLGMQLRCHLDGMNTDFTVSVDWISPEAEYTPPIIFSNETRSKLCFMVEAKPEATMATRLHPGQPLTVSLYE